MVWAHCDDDAILDDLRCPKCGMSKAEWTVKVGATRVFKLSLPKKKKADAGWLELVLLEPDGSPAREAAYVVDLPTGRSARGALVLGKARVEAIPEGTCRVTFPGLRPRPADAPEAAPEGERWLVADPAPDDGSGVEVPTGQVHTFRRSHWLEVQVLDDVGFPLADEPFAVEFADGTPRHEGRLDREGLARVDGLLRGGPCDLVFPGRRPAELRLESSA